MAYSGIFCFTFKHADRDSTLLQNNNEESCALLDVGPTSSVTQIGVTGMQVVREAMRECQLSSGIIDTIMSSWKDRTQQQYSVYINRWLHFCVQRNDNPMSPSVRNLLEFPHELFMLGYNYSTLNTARSAVSSICLNVQSGKECNSLGKHPLVCRFMKGVFNKTPPTPKFNEIWSVDIVLEYLKLFHPVQTLKLKDLTFKLVMLVALVTGQRCQTLACLDISEKYMKKFADHYSFALTNHLKQDRPGKSFGNIRLYKYNQTELCVYEALSQYISMTQSLRKSSQLFVSYIRPYDKVSSTTIGRWLQAVLAQAGIDIDIYKAHSTRSASTTKAAKVIPINMLLDLAGWSQESTFRQFYDKPVAVTNQMGSSVLDRVK